MLFPGLALAYDGSYLLERRPLPIGVKNLLVPVALFAAVVGWILIQTITLPTGLAHPIWALASDVLKRSLPGSISVNRDLTVLALVRMLTAASVFWLAVQIGSARRSAAALIISISVIIALYAAWGIFVWAERGELALSGPTSAEWVYLSATFVNRNSFATYAAIGVVIAVGWFCQPYDSSDSAKDVPPTNGSWPYVKTLESTGFPIAAAGLISLAALLLTGSRGGIIATAVAIAAMLLLLTGVDRRAHGQRPTAYRAVLLTVLAALSIGSLFLSSLTMRGVYDSDRLAVDAITLRSIADEPGQGFGFGTFADVFPLYRDRSISVSGVWDQAHNTYLEALQGLGLFFGSALIGCIIILVALCARAARQRPQQWCVAGVAVGVSVLIGTHALVDFSLQIQAVTLTFAALLGAGVAQSVSGAAE